MINLPEPKFVFPDLKKINSNNFFKSNEVEIVDDREEAQRLIKYNNNIE